MKRSLTCICCPKGCTVFVDAEDGRVLSVEGNGCEKGHAYAVQEAVAPMRVLTGIMRAEGCERPFAVRTDRPVPKERMRECAAALKRVRPKAPIRIGDVVIRDLAGTGAGVRTGPADGRAVSSACSGTAEAS